jgi:hypothetical protein
LVYEDVGSLLESLSISKITVGCVALALTVYGLIELQKVAGRRAAFIIGSSLGVGLMLKLFGSFVPVIETMNPVRFLLPVVVLAAIPLGMACWSLANRLRLSSSLLIPAVAISVLLVAKFAPRSPRELSDETFFGGKRRPRPASFPFQLPSSVPLLKSYDPVLNFIAEHTKPTDRLLIQTLSQSEQLVVPQITGRETIGSAYPSVSDPAQFHYDRLFDRKLADWQPETLRPALQRWGVSWVFTCSPQAEKLLSQTTGEMGQQLGMHRVFRFGEEVSHFLKGSGEVAASLNRFKLSNLVPDERGVVVLRYRYHPAWHCQDPAVEIFSWPVPEDAVGFIALRNPPPECRLEFSAVAALTADWPAELLTPALAPDSTGTKHEAEPTVP